jgi:ParB family chromosome partitioning protein
MEPTTDSQSMPSAIPPQYRKFPIAQIKSTRSQARKNFPEEGIQSLARTMKESSLDNPIHLRLLPDGSAELVSGERRLRAAKLLGWQGLGRG